MNKISTYIIFSFFVFSLYACGGGSAPKVTVPGQAASTNAECAKYSNTSTVVNESLTLPANCVLTDAQFFIRASNVKVDCNGAIIRNGSNIVNALWVQAKQGEWRPVNSGFTRCNVYGGQYGFRPHFNLGVAKAKELSADPDAMLPYLYANGPVGAYVTSSLFANQVKEGAYFWVGAQDTVFKNNQVFNSGATCLYLTSATKGAIVDGNTFKGCGFDRRRECVAVDGSNDNTISNNRFEGCHRESVAIYHNDGEYAPVSWDGRINPSPDDLHIPRLQTSSGNQFIGNTSLRAGNGVAFSSGHRADKGYSARRYSSRKPYLQDNSLNYFSAGGEYAVFKDNDCGGQKITIKSDHATVSGNTGCVLEVGSKRRDQAGIPVIYRE